MNKEIKIGFIAISTVFVLFVGINYLKGLNVLNSQRVYYAQYNFLKFFLILSYL